MKKVFSKILGIVLILFGIGIYAYPSINTWLLNRQTEQYLSEFQEKYRSNIPEESNPSSGKPEPESGQSEESGETEPETRKSEGSELSGKPRREKQEDPLYQEIQAYNEEIYHSGQEGFRDAWSIQQSPVSLDGLEDGKYGYIQIPAMDLTLPLYIGASDSNMAKGAVVLGQTSIPMGEINSNAVIAGHRGWSTGDFFLDIEELSIGNHIYITNPWETLSYKVSSIDIIDPYDVDAVKIQEGKDMVTLVTCHPYMSRGKYRYLVYCIRDEDDTISDSRSDSGTDSKTDKETDEETAGETAVIEETQESGYIVSSSGQRFETSSGEIQKEDMIRKGCALAMILMVICSFGYAHFRDRKS